MMEPKWRMSNGEWGPKPSRPNCAPASGKKVPGTFSQRHREKVPGAFFPRGVTLIELLITMVIMAIISAAILGTARAAMESARRSRTKSTITKINTLLMERWDSYSTRRVEVSPAIVSAINALYPAQISSAERGQMMADARLLALRELMQMEMPDRWSDVINQPVEDVADQSPSNFFQPKMLAAVPAVAQTYYRRLVNMHKDVNGDQITGNMARDNQSAECLYLTIMYATGEGEARTHFLPQDIGDTDGDGAPEFLDGWGNPIFFVRWPAGFVSNSPLMTGDPEVDHDPFDPLRRDIATTPPDSRYPSIQPFRKLVVTRVRNRSPHVAAYRLMPLIFSGGPDNDPGLHLAPVAVVDDPYSTYVSSGVDALLASPLTVDLAGSNYDGDNWKDNINNHLSN
jgi:prepilin-type N-terminal cleavage/methylation domain-containing protein